MVNKYNVELRKYRQGREPGQRIHSLVKVAALASGIGGLWKLYMLANQLTWEKTAESAIYSHWVRFCAYLYQNGVLSTYLPQDGSGIRLQQPSTSHIPYKKPPRSISDAMILRPLTIRGLTIRNRVVRAAAFDGETEQEVLDTHIDQAKGGVGMTTVAYCSVSRNGRTFDDQIVMEESRRPFLTNLCKEVHSHGAAISAQLTHGGSFADPEVIHPEAGVAPSSVFSLSGFYWPREMTENDLNNMLNSFGESARLAQECGFDAIELHCGHGYLLSQFLSPSTNLRTDHWGGSPEKRAAFPCAVLRRIREEVGDLMPIIVKLNMYDGAYGGLELPEATIAAKALIRASADAFVLTGGHVTQNGFYMLRGSTPHGKLMLALPHKLKKMAVLIFGPLAVPSLEYEDCFFRDGARYILRELGSQVPICLMGGVNSLSQMEGAIEEGFQFVQMARGLIREPDFVNRIQATLRLQEAIAPDQNPEDVKSACIHCNMCVIASINPSATSGCPFQKLDAKRRQAANLPSILSVEQIEKTLGLPTKSKSNIVPSGETAVRDIEDIILVDATKPKL